MSSLAFQKCLHHGEREAVARCPNCRSFFCRECIAEHGGRLLCADCLARSGPGGGNKTAARKALLPLGAAGGLLLAWLFFLGLGKILVAIPTSFHEAEWENGESP
jgi:hypothetical protein